MHGPPALRAQSARRSPRAEAGGAAFDSSFRSDSVCRFRSASSRRTPSGSPQSGPVPHGNRATGSRSSVSPIPRHHRCHCRHRCHRCHRCHRHPGRERRCSCGCQAYDSSHQSFLLIFGRRFRPCPGRPGQGRKRVAPTRRRESAGCGGSPRGRPSPGARGRAPRPRQSRSRPTRRSRRRLRARPGPSWPSSRPGRTSG